MRLKTLALASLFILPVSASAETAAGLIKQHTVTAAAALETYLESKPDADDEMEALDYLIESYARLDDKPKQIKHLERKYQLVPKGAAAEARQFFEVFQSLIALYIDSGDKGAGRDAVARAKKDLAGHPEAERFTTFVDQIAAPLKQPGIGDTMDIKFTSVQGDEIDLAAMKGKVVLVDFWATWCGPCMREMPNVKATYDELHDKGFEVIGISLDEEKTKKRLDGVIENGEMPWPHAYDGGGWQSALAQEFGISSIPATFLVGKGGKIIATNLRGDKLGEAVRKELGL